MLSSNSNLNYSMTSNPYEEATSLAIDGHNLIVTGQAGTGKSFLLTQIADQLTKNGKTVQKAASTGLAASIIAEDTGACTLHNFCGLKIGNLSDDQLKNVASQNDVSIRLCLTDCLLIDEMSMVSDDIIRQANIVLCEARQCSRPFGGMQVILFGDFYQLPPVKSAHIFNWNYFDAAVPHRINLTRNYRCDYLKKTSSCKLFLLKMFLDKMKQD